MFTLNKFQLGSSRGRTKSRLNGGRRRRAMRRAAAAVEFAFVMPVFMSMVLGMVEVGRGVMVMQTLTYAAREGCRTAVLDGSTASIVTAKVDAAMDGSAINLPPATVTITPTNPSSAKYDEPVTVAVQVRYSDVSWVPMAQYFQPNAMLKASITMRRETVK